MATLPELLNHFTSIESRLAESGGEITPELELELNELSQSMAVKVDYLAYLCERAPVVANYYRDQAKRYLKIGQALDALPERVKDNMRHALFINGLDKIDGDEFSFLMQKPRVSVEIYNEADIPTHLCTVVYKPSKTAIKPVLEAGGEVPGASLVHKAPIVVKPIRKSLK